MDLRKLRYTVGLGLVAALLTLPAMAEAVKVTELKPGDLAGFLARHHYAVVQLTSPNPSCTYCVGADRTFDQAAALPHRKGLVFARVQWSPWNKFPDFGPLITEVYGLPSHFVFQRAKVVSNVAGRPRSAEQLLANIDEAIDHPPPPRSPAGPAPDAAPEPLPAPLTDAEQRTTRLGVRQQFIAAVAEACGRKFPAHAQQYRAAVQAWSSANKAVLDQAAMLVITRSSRADAKAMAPLIDAEQKALQAWQADNMGIPMQKAPTMADCDKLTAGFASLP